jgi:hypothetical protein
MTWLTRRTVLVFALIAAVGAGGVAAGATQSGPLRGACYCRTARALQCTGDLTEEECQRRCDERLCDEWFWKERLPCWNWGYGG